MIGMLATIAIIAILAVVFLKGSGAFGGQSISARKDHKGTTTVGLAELAAKDTVCRSNLAQDRAALEIAQTNNDGSPPAKLQDIHFPKEFYKCPVGGEAYVYDPVTGTVHCPHPGHEKY